MYTIFFNTLGNPAQVNSAPPRYDLVDFLEIPIKSKVFNQTLHKSQDRHKNSFSFDFNNKNTKNVFRILRNVAKANLPTCSGKAV